MSDLGIGVFARKTTARCVSLSNSTMIGIYVKTTAPRQKKQHDFLLSDNMMLL